MRSFRRRGAALLGAGLVLATLAGCSFDGAYDLPLPGSPVDSDHAITVTADFRDVVSVVPRSTVQVDDVTVGEVTDIERVGWHARVTFNLRDDVDVPENARAEIRQTSLLGEKYIALIGPGDGKPEGRLSDGDNIGLDRTGRNPEVEEVLGALSFLLSGGGVAQLGTITRELNEAMDGHEADLRGLLGNLDDVVGTLNDQRGDIVRALEAVNDLSATLNRQSSVITRALRVTGPAVDVLDQQNKELVTMLTSLDQLGKVGTRVIGATKDDLLAQLADLRPVLNRLADAGNAIGPGLNLLVSFPFPVSASDVVFGDYANTITLLDIDLKSLTKYVTTGGSGDGGGGVPSLPSLPDAIDQVTKCLQSGDISSKSCSKVLGSSAITDLMKACKKKANKNNAVCQALGLLGQGGASSGSSGSGLNLPLLPGLSRLSASLASGDSEPPTDDESLWTGSSFRGQP
ncbi:MCE family protein [Nocardioides sp. CBS4Y-1]|uniref:MCE family protein n=1 Tax=Nocardioides acrostichi TaxID=2784339 RepID=A0A930UXX5_9ACTN|nr:MCE family protein [Nocardioides acrostichi]